MTTSNIPQRVDRENFIIVVVFSLLVLFGIGLHLHKQWVNFPFIDDYQTIVDFLNHTKSDSFTRLITYTVWQPHNEHRIVFTRLAATVYAYLSPDGVRFDVLCASGLVFLGLMLLPLYQQWRSAETSTTTTDRWSVVGFVTIVFVIANGRVMDNLSSATCALQNIPVVTWALLAFGAASRKKWLLAWGLGVLATLTSGNGIFVLLLLSFERLLKRRWIAGSIAMTVSIAIYLLYRTEMNLVINSQQLATLIPKFLSFQGSLFYLHYYLQEYGVAYTLPSLVAGLVYTVVGIETLWRYLNGRISLFYPAVFTFVWLTALPVALLRPGVLESRYAIYSMILTSVVYARLTEYVRLYRPDWLRIMHPVALIAAFVLFLQSYLVFDRTIQGQYRTTLAEYYTFAHNTSTIYDQPRQKLSQLQNAGLYSTAPVERMAESVFMAHNNTAIVQPAMRSTYKGYSFVRTALNCNFLLFKQGQNQVVLPTDSHEDVIPFTTFFMPSWLPKGTYTVHFVNSEGIWPTSLSVSNSKERPLESPDECR